MPENAYVLVLLACTSVLCTHHRSLRLRVLCRRIRIYLDVEEDKATSCKRRDEPPDEMSDE